MIEITRKERLYECKEQLESYMEKVEATRDIWQNDAYWWIAKTCCEIISAMVIDDGRERVTKELEQLRNKLEQGG